MAMWFNKNLSGSYCNESPILGRAFLYSDFVLNGHRGFMPFEKLVFVHVQDFGQWPVRYLGQHNYFASDVATEPKKPTYTFCSRA